MARAAMLWSGGKDSALALHEAVRDGYNVCCLITFAPPEPEFLAHPLEFMELQARALALPHHVLTVEAPFAESYEAGLHRLRDDMDIDRVVTGDIAEIDHHPNWIRERALAAGIDVHTPLWHRERGALLRQYLDSGFRARISCVNTRWLDESWAGREFNEAAVVELHEIHERTGLDPSGEQGEYHSLTTGGPSFTRSIDIRAYSVDLTGELAYMRIRQTELVGAE